MFRKAILVSVLGLFSLGFSKVPDVTITDILDVEYDVYGLLDKGHYMAFYMMSLT